MLTPVPEASQTVNPVFKLAANNGVTDNNGVIIELPAVGAMGALSVTGSLIFGISTQANNALAGSANVITTQQFTGLVTTHFNGQNISMSYFDTGTNSINFDDGSVPACTSQSGLEGFLCPTSTLNLTATVSGTNAANVAVFFSIANASSLASESPGFTAFSNLGGTGGGSFAWGLPFFYGQKVYFAMENTDAGGTVGPYVAF